ncbi:MAG: SpoIIE family protein phosphatase [Treponema sp.]|jgi:serine phosphatase RsbU (regulator of sigma subunit)|nr:SpoIIE family protein phosphatase [Treponema sp.]
MKFLRCKSLQSFRLPVVIFIFLTLSFHLLAEEGGIRPEEAGAVPALTPVNQTDIDGTGSISPLKPLLWKIRPKRYVTLDMWTFLFIGIMLFSLIGLGVLTMGIAGILREGMDIRKEISALAGGDILPFEQKRRFTGLRKRGAGLRLKLTSFIIVLVLLVTVMVSTPLYVWMTRLQRETLFEGFRERSTILLEGLASSLRVCLAEEPLISRAREGLIPELSFLPNQISAVPEARYVTITGFDPSGQGSEELVWATNDPDILNKIDTPVFRPGVSRFTDELSPNLGEISSRFNNQSRLEAGDRTAALFMLYREEAALLGRTDEQDIKRREDIRATIEGLEARIGEQLAAISREIGSLPAYGAAGFVPDKSALSRRIDSLRRVHTPAPWGGTKGMYPESNTLREQHTPTACGGVVDNENHSFILFMPILFPRYSDNTFFRGLIRLEVSIDSILDQIAGDQWNLLKMILLVAGAALIIGTLGTFILSTLILHPIQKLVSYVELIRDTEDKTKLEGVEIKIKTWDELEVLGTTINDMIVGLVNAAQASKDLTIGKELQKKFIPLETDKEGNKLTSGFKNTACAEFFGYYEGAKGVSGDYFDYIDLDGRFYAIIKCDAAGKGVPAALIMIQVATMFLNHFKNWTSIENGQYIEEVVYQINDFIEALGFEGRFAAFILCLFDSETGLLRCCNAGDNIVHYYDHSEKRLKSITLPQSPAAGVLPNFLVESKGGYTVQTFTLDHGDILFLYTDGIEEAKRNFRDSSFNEITCTEGDAPAGTPHANHVAGQGNEQLGVDRVEGIINGVMNKRFYSLYKYHNPEGENELQFDFTSCSGTVEEAIMALVAVEKMFRLYKNPGAGDDSRVLVDRKVDRFLKEHFTQYRNYCGQTREPGENSVYTSYTHVMEDPQYDDLTILGIRRK